MATVSTAKMPRKLVPADSNLCDHCTAKCCRYFALPVERPRNASDFDYIRWYLLHQYASVFLEDGVWYLLVHTVCKHLQEDNRCGIYETRPQICRDYKTDNCEYDDRWTYDRYFETPEQVEEYMDSVLPRRKGDSIRGRKPPLMPIL